MNVLNDLLFRIIIWMFCFFRLVMCRIGCVYLCSNCLVLVLWRIGGFLICVCVVENGVSVIVVVVMRVVRVEVCWCNEMWSDIKWFWLMVGIVICDGFGDWWCVGYVICFCEFYFL